MKRKKLTVLEDGSPFHLRNIVVSAKAGSGIVELYINDERLAIIKVGPPAMESGVYFLEPLLVEPHSEVTYSVMKGSLKDITIYLESDEV